MKSDIRWKQRFSNYEKAVQDLDEAGRRTELDKLGRAGLIQMFEVAFELAWKTLMDKLEYEGYEVHSPRAVIKCVFRGSLSIDSDLEFPAIPI